MALTKIRHENRENTLQGKNSRGIIRTLQKITHVGNLSGALKRSQGSIEACGCKTKGEKT